MPEPAEIVQYLRAAEEMYYSGNSPVSGKQILKVMLEHGRVSLSEYIEIYKATGNPEVEIVL